MSSRLPIGVAITVSEPLLTMTEQVETAEAAYEWARGEDEGASTQAALEACLGELSDQARHALALRYGEELERSAIASRLGLGIDGVKSLLRRSSARLRACIERRLGNEHA